eukprot:TRINITY_DN8246_c0_g3_i1.p3 TRINITY_DN8246_c0_g3~~TRINITY_DN8246_c0_g3_i1.p3  ORF type:complete len:107 (+),score=43.31 TRINITY_DN8246_c0_g3_i1:79-399(+)
MLGWARALLNMSAWDFSLWDAAEMLLSAANPATGFALEFWSVATLVGAALYVVLPVDLLPDVIPVVGWGDDVVAVRRAAGVISAEMLRYKAFKEQQARELGLGRRD